MSSATCPYCGRHAQACWIMPCLSLDTALHEATENGDERRLQKWAKLAGVKLQKKT